MLLPSSHSKKEDGERRADGFICVYQCFIVAALPAVQVAGCRYCSATSLHVGAEVVAGLERPPVSERDEPQEFPTSATNFS